MSIHTGQARCSGPRRRRSSSCLIRPRPPLVPPPTTPLPRCGPGSCRWPFYSSFYVDNVSVAAHHAPQRPQRIKRADQESYVAYTLYCVAFCIDGSVLTMVYPLSLFLYALLSSSPAAAYWQVPVSTVATRAPHASTCVVAHHHMRHVPRCPSRAFYTRPRSSCSSSPSCCSSPTTPCASQPASAAPWWSRGLPGGISWASTPPPGHVCRSLPSTW